MVTRYRSSVNAAQPSGGDGRGRPRLSPRTSARKGDVRYLIARFLIYCCLAVILVSCSDSGSEKTKALKETQKVFPSVTEIKYEYKGVLALLGSPASAVAYYGDAVVARADVTIDVNRPPESLVTLEVEETHYNREGLVVYKGRVVFAIRGIGYAVSKIKAISGRRPFEVFSSWPLNLSGHGF